eukprot:TRINITY_DN1707_c0_g1_i2.p1 TRINITY_DN1707_c0_g1~~TRINITY_DN1707_c0_g1_i2.p1  ORF type:complete len:208 (-),score=33.85 TRINITY_DN1707_c0_g1_i2:771-1394(-)
MKSKKTAADTKKLVGTIASVEKTAGVRRACPKCVRGHRVGSCQHFSEQTVILRRRGRPKSKCTQCQSSDKHQRCSCHHRSSSPDIHRTLSSMAVETTTASEESLPAAESHSTTTTEEGDRRHDHEIGHGIADYLVSLEAHDSHEVVSTPERIAAVGFEDASFPLRERLCSCDCAFTLCPCWKCLNGPCPCVFAWDITESILALGNTN